MEQETHAQENSQSAEPQQEEEILLFDGENDAELAQAVKKERRSLMLIAGLMTVALILAVLWLVLDPLGTVSKRREEETIAATITEPLPYGTVDLYVPAIGNASSTLLLAPDGTSMLIDCGDEKHWDTVSAMLKRLGITHIDMLMLTHMHDDSIGALPLLLDEFSVGEVYMSDQSSASPTCENALAAMEFAGITPKKLLLSPSDTGPMELSFADHVTLTVLSPINGTYINANNFSLMVRAGYGNTGILFTGDAGIAEEKIAVKALSNHYFRATVLMVAQNGDSDATGESFLSKVRPSYAVIHTKEAPDGKTINRLTSTGATILRTDTEGEIHITLDGIAATVVE